jgi:cyanate permease
MVKFEIASCPSPALGIENVTWERRLFVTAAAAAVVLILHGFMWRLASALMWLWLAVGLGTGTMMLCVCVMLHRV